MNQQIGPAEHRWVISGTNRSTHRFESTTAPRPHTHAMHPATSRHTGSSTHNNGERQANIDQHPTDPEEIQKRSSEQAREKKATTRLSEQ